MRLREFPVDGKHAALRRQFIRDHPSPHGRLRNSGTLHLTPLKITSKILPQPLQAPNHCDLSVRKMLKQAVEQQAGDLAGLVVTAVCHLLHEYRTDRDERRESISE